MEFHGKEPQLRNVTVLTAFVITVDHRKGLGFSSQEAVKGLSPETHMPRLLLVAHLWETNPGLDLSDDSGMGQTLPGMTQTLAFSATTRLASGRLLPWLLPTQLSQ